MERIVVSVHTCRSYDHDCVDASVNAILADLGGIGSFIRPGQTVLLKPNLLFGEPPERAVTTHPQVVRSVALQCLQAGARIVCGDSPGYGSCRGAAERSGVTAALQDLEVVLGDFGRSVNHGPENGRRFPVATEVAEADLLINLPKLKTHGQMVISGAVKNLFGCVVGFRKPAYHSEHPEVDDLAGLMLDLAHAVAPGLTIMDAVVGMEGPGPHHGAPRQIGILLGSRDPLALDFVAAELLGVKPEHVPILRVASARRYPAADPAGITAVGENPASLRLKDFQLPPNQTRADFKLPPFLLKLAGGLMAEKPRITGLCHACGICGAVCPAKAITIDSGRARIDRKKCINCYCCEEMCSHGAILLKQRLIRRLFSAVGLDK